MHPDHMVEPGKAQFYFGLLGAQHPDDHVLHVDRHVAQANDLRLAVAADRLGDDPRRISKVENERFRRQLFHFARHLKDHRDRPQRLGKTADAGGLLAQQVVLETQPLIGGARRQLSDTQLGQHKAGAADGLIERNVDADRHLLQPFMFQHPPGQRGDDLHLFPAGFDIYQRQLCDRKLLVTNDNPFNKLRRVAAAAADNGNFQCLHSVLFSDFRHTERRARSPGPHVMMMKNGMRKLVFEQG